MRLATFTESGVTRLGVVLDDGLVDLAAAAPELPREMIAFLEAGEGARACAAEAAAAARSRLALDAVQLGPPVLRPPKFLAIGLNYADHVAESGAQVPKFPTVFNKQSTCVTGPHALGALDNPVVPEPADTALL